MKEQKMILPKIDDLFTTQEERETKENVRDIKISLIDNFTNHPFKVVNNEEMKKLTESIKENNVLVPVLVRPKPNGRYEMVSGHRRNFASKLCGLDTIPAIVRDLTDDEATIIMVDSNMQREEILPSERAFAYKMKLDALKHQGKRNDLTSVPMAQKSSRELIGEQVGESQDQVRRYIRLTELIPELLELVDEKQIAFRPAVELSYLKEEEQRDLLDFIDYNDATPSLAQAIRLKKLSQEGKLDTDALDDILSEEKPNQIPKIKINESKLRSVLPKGIENKQIEDFVVNAVKYYNKYLERKKDLGDR